MSRESDSTSTDSKAARSRHCSHRQKKLWQKAMGFFSKRRKNEPSFDYDKETEYPCLRCSICNGERVAGFKNRATGQFREVSLITSEAQLEEFRAGCGVADIPREY